MTTTMQTALALGLLALWGCTPAQVETDAVNEDEARALAAPEPGAAAGEYRKRAVTLRLFGTQGSGDGAFATVAETDTWQTRDVRVGQTLGRNLVLTEVREDGVRLRDGARALLVPVGADLPAVLVEHQFDRAVRDLGEHVYAVQPAALARLQARYGFGGGAERVSVPDGQGREALRLTTVAPGSLLARLGLGAGDLIYAVDGELPAPEGLPRALSRLLSPESGAVLVQVGHGHSLWEATYRAQ